MSVCADAAQKDREMPAVNRIAAFAEDRAAWRRPVHAPREPGLDCRGTARRVAGRLRGVGGDAIGAGIAGSGLAAPVVCAPPA